MIIARRFNGPDGSGNGGYVAGALAAHVDSDTVTVSLRRPPPLETHLRVSPADDRWLGAWLWDGDDLVAEALTGAIVVPPVPPAPREVAREAAEKFRAQESHPFPHCFVCGPEREAGDGMLLAPGRVDAETVASPWTPDGAVTPELVWAALDCPGGWSFDQNASMALLGTMTAQVLDLPETGEECLVMGRARSREGRKLHAATALYGAGGRLLGRSEQIWIEIDPNRVP
ncbi:hypothetical protein [Actinomadura flavalba]|uniref:hypothetical protein n=1 Tax=Actinomadura flavalba TaxID=1120938 RepID=UPI00035D6D0B|nr:hypothetical protein [Actinomadura flavalba]